MCGIIGYIGDREKKQIVLDGLAELEYRGYDSAGIATLSDDNLYIFKSAGKRCFRKCGSLILIVNKLSFCKLNTV